MSTATPAIQNYNGAFPFSTAFYNQFQGENLPVLYILNQNTSQAKDQQQVKISISITDSNVYVLQGFGFVPPSPDIPNPSSGTTLSPTKSSFVPGPEKYNLAIAFRPGTLKDSVLNSFTETLQEGVSNALGDTNNCVTNGPIQRSSDGALVWYCAFQNDLQMTQQAIGSAISSFEIMLEGISAMSGVGSRSTQVEFQFANILLNDGNQYLSFKDSCHISIINHEGRTHAPMFFGILGSNQLLNNIINSFTIYFETIDRKPLQFGENTEIDFMFPYGDPDNESIHFGTVNDVSGYEITVGKTTFQTSQPPSDNLCTIKTTFPAFGSITNPEIAEYNNKIITTNNLATDCSTFFISKPNGPQQTVLDFFNDQIQPVIENDKLINQCASALGGYYTGGAMGEVKTLAINYGKQNGIGISGFMMDSNQPFQSSSWQSCVNNMYGAFLQLGGIYQITNGVLPNSAFTAAWENANANVWDTHPDLLAFVQKNWTSLCQSLPAPFKFFTALGPSYIVPCAALYDYFQIKYAEYLEIEKFSAIQGLTDPAQLYSDLLLDIHEPFSTEKWLSGYNLLHQNLPSNDCLTQSVQGIDSTFDPSNPWTDDAFSSYVTNNFSELYSQIENPPAISLGPNSYAVPCQSLYDFLWLNYQSSQLKDKLADLPATVDEYIAPSSYVFQVSNVQLSGNDGHVNVNVNVRNIPGYWDTNFQIPVVKAASILNNDLNMPTGNASIGGNLTVSKNSELQGDLSVGGTSTMQGDFAVLGTTSLEGNLSANGKGSVQGDFTVSGITNLQNDLSVNGKSELQGDLSVGAGFISNTYNTQTPPNPSPQGAGGLTIGWNKSGGSAEVNFYNTFGPQPNTAYMFSALSNQNNKEVWQDLVSITGTGRIRDVTGEVMPVGSIIAYGGAAAPDGWLICDGSPITQISHPDLYNVVGKNLPDLRSRFIVGAGTETGAGLTPRNLGTSGGDESVALDINQMPSHDHSYTYYNPIDPPYDNGNVSDAIVNKYVCENDRAGTEGAIQSKGQGQPHNNIPPYYALTYIIKY